MARVIDLTRTIEAKMPVFPGDPEVDFFSHHTHEATGYCVSRFAMGTHTGTHIDVPLHKIASGMPVDEIPLERMMGRAVIADLRDLKKNEEISIKHLEAWENELKDCSILILKTGWSEHFGRDDFFCGFNGISQEAAEWLSRKKLSMVGLESPSVHPVTHQRIHQIFLKSNVLVVETLCNLESVKQTTVQFFALPLKLKGLDGSPIRAFAVEE